MKQKNKIWNELYEGSGIRRRIAYDEDCNHTDEKSDATKREKSE